MTDYSNIPDCFYRVSIKALVLDEEGGFLLIRESDGNWSFPGGGLEYSDKSIKECLKRELYEEMGVELLSVDEQPSYFVVSENSNGFFQANVFYKTVLKNLNFMPSDECREIRFFASEEAKNLYPPTNV